AAGVVPPAVRMPAHLVAPPDGMPVASRTDELVAFWEARGGQGSFDVAAQLADVRAILGANALAFADVAKRVGGILEADDLADVEIARWSDLAALEGRYLEALRRRGKVDRVLAVRDVLTSPPRIEGVEAAVVACVLDPLPLMSRALDAMGLPVTELRPSPPASSPLLTGQIEASGTGAAEAEKVAAIFAAVKADEALPALCLADSGLFPEIQGALQAKGIRVHRPSATPLATSSLGHLVAQVAALKRTSSYAVFSAFIRGGDVRRMLCARLGYTQAELSAALVRLDALQAKLLPERMEDVGSKADGALRNIYEFVAKEFRKKGVRELLRSVFADLVLDERDADAREFAAAAAAVRDLLDECFAPDVPAAAQLELFERRLGEATYSLEPDEGDVILTDGWLELPFLDADELVVAGFQEGCVPESVVGHPFLPDSLRRGLGLPDNAARGRRDREILDLALACRDPGAVRIFFHAIDAAGNVLKPSRLLFEGADDATLADRARRFYSLRAGTAESASPDLPADWRLRLAVPPPHAPLAHASPSSLDLYLKCPFTYILKKTFGERMDDRAEELDPSEFGALAHGALEAWAGGPLRDSSDAREIAASLAGEVDAILAQRFGVEVPAIVALQGESVKRRLANFAAVQAARRAEGWRIVASERKLEVCYGHTRVHGRCDRVDFHEATGEWCVIDYKTWDSAARAVSYDAKNRVWRSLQLPLYCAMLDADPAPEFASAKLDSISSAYCVLGKTAADVLFTEPMRGAFVAEAEREVRRLVDRIERGVFWPPAPTNEWQWDFGDWMFGTPAASVDPAWLADQERRLAELAAQDGQ
ncbi:MAG: PD-(D/E)XK nuclease family protein, partial [Kiritimatiellae bacterium]|nr:PD-(D/E)XK nuclease family protein [Kiritimatiellia bacterium]